MINEKSSFSVKEKAQSKISSAKSDEKLLGDEIFNRRMFLADELSVRRIYLTDEYFWLTNIFGRRICLLKIISTLKILNFESESDFEIDIEIENGNLDDYNVDLAGAIGENNQEKSEGPQKRRKRRYYCRLVVYIWNKRYFQDY